MTMTYAGTTALITGASSGLGAEFAGQFAARGSNLVLVARRGDRLEELAQELRSRHGVTVTVLPKDLGLAGVGRELFDELAGRGISVDTLINNAGFGTHGPLIEEDPETIASEISLNVAALVDITRAFLPELLASGKGALVNVASTAAFQPIPGMAVYGATKAFVLSFTEAVAHETKKSGLTSWPFAPVQQEQNSSMCSAVTPQQWARCRPLHRLWALLSRPSTARTHPAAWSRAGLTALRPDSRSVCPGPSPSPSLHALYRTGRTGRKGSSVPRLRNSG
uniref:NADP-dependent 3-hydroxy acid dehydrogenase YdfG n=1 Tax=Paenarthrobacter ilicis TaxID=43665 RepID=Q7WSR3_9MICC|nr:putative short chain dehydrogenase [Paenarthrobacter ilicis]